MDEKKNKQQNTVNPVDDEDERELFDELFSVASSMECTGLIPAAPANRDEVHSYSEIYDIPLATGKPKSKTQTEKEQK